MRTKIFTDQWQVAFNQAVNTLLESVFQILELPIAFKTFMIGIPVSTQDIAQIFFQDPSCGFTPEQFERVFELAKKNFDNDPEQLFFMGAADQNQAHKESLYPKALRQAVSSIIQKYDSSSQQVSFCSFPVKKNQYWIIAVVRLHQQDFDSQYRLSKEEHEINPMRKYRIERCFLEAVIYRILTECELELHKPLLGETFAVVNPKRVIEDAATNLLRSIEVHVNKWNQVDLLSFANAIAAERYEGAVSKGRLIICNTNHLDISAKVKLKVPISIDNYRGIRKLLEVSSSQMALLCDVDCVWGFGVPLNTYQPSLEDLFEIRFTEHYTWELVHAENIMLRVKYREPRLPRERFDKEHFYSRLYQLFKVSKIAADKLVVAVEAAVEQRHGTMLVITPEAASETKRLAAQSTAIEPITICKEIISHVTSVDGAILLSADGVVHSFGVILDGKVTENGNPARGARYNSAIRYVDGEQARNVNCLALIVSEDGYVDLYPHQ